MRSTKVAYTVASVMNRRWTSLYVRFDRWQLAIFVALLLFCSPRTASATCGDYLGHHSHGQMQHPMDDSGSESEHDVPRAPCPCHGPSCRESQPLSSTPPVPVERNQEQWAVTSSRIDLPSFNAQPVHPESTVAGLTKFSQRLDRPPR